MIDYSHCHHHRGARKGRQWCEARLRDRGMERFQVVGGFRNNHQQTVNRFVSGVGRCWVHEGAL